MSSEVKANKLSPATGADVVLGDASDTFTVPSGATLDVSSATMTGFTIPSGQTLTVASGGTITNSGTATGFSSGDNTPSFAATMGSDQSVTSGTWTLLEFDTEDWDTDSAFDSTTNYRFTVPTGEGGKYLILYGARMNGVGSGNQIYGAIYLNNSYVEISDTGNMGADGFEGNPRYTCSVVLALTAGDYIDHRFVQNSGGTLSIEGGRSYFQAFKLNGV